LISGNPDLEIASSTGSTCLTLGLADAVAWPLGTPPIGLSVAGCCAALRMSGWPGDIGV
jgi:hypothetical protein